MTAPPYNLAGPEVIFRDIVLPNYREFLTDQLSVRRAYNTAVSIAHMADHIALRPGGSGKPRQTRELFKSRHQSFAMVDAMCNAIKHVYATGGGKPNPIVATATSMITADPADVLFVEQIDGKPQEFRPTAPFLVFDYTTEGRTRKAWVAWSLYGALLFVAGEIECEGDLADADFPDRNNLTYRTVSITR